jgi:hypothetical protein
MAAEDEFILSWVDDDAAVLADLIVARHGTGQKRGNAKRYHNYRLYERFSQTNCRPAIFEREK